MTTEKSQVKLRGIGLCSMQEQDSPPTCLIEGHRDLEVFHFPLTRSNPDGHFLAVEGLKEAAMVLTAVQP